MRAVVLFGFIAPFSDENVHVWLGEHRLRLRTVRTAGGVEYVGVIVAEAVTGGFRDSASVEEPTDPQRAEVVRGAELARAVPSLRLLVVA